MYFLEKIKEKIDYRFLISFIAVLSILFALLPNKLCIDNLIYAVGQINAFDHNLFKGNIYLAEGVISPRYISDFIFSIIMHLNGGNWAEVTLLWVYTGTIVQSLAIANIANRINKDNQIIISAILICMMEFCNNYLALYDFLAPDNAGSTSIGPAIAFAVLSLSYLVGENRNYKISWIIAACSIIFNIHEGLYCCGIIFIIALVDCIVQKKILFKENKSIVVPVLALIAVAAPNLVTDYMKISDEEFVYIYSYLRHPHHLIPSVWGIELIAKTFLIDISLFLFSIITIYITKKGILKKRILESIALAAVWIIVVLLMYIYTEIKPVAFISTLILSKSFKYIFLMGLIWTMEAIVDLRKNNCYVSSYLVLYYIFTVSHVNLAWVIFIITIIISFINIENAIISKKITLINKNIIVIIDTLFFFTATFIILVNILNHKAEIARILACAFFGTLFIMLLDKWKIKVHKYLCTIICFCMLVLSSWGKFFVYDDGNFYFITDKDIIKKPIGNSLYYLAKNFKNKTNTEDEFLADPLDRNPIMFFQVISQRNCYAAWKIIPSFKCKMGDWYDRIKKASEFDYKTGKEIEDIMLSEKIKYVLVQRKNFDKLDSMSDFSIFMSSPDDMYRIYQLN